MGSNSSHTKSNFWKLKTERKPLQLEKVETLPFGEKQNGSEFLIRNQEAQKKVAYFSNAERKELPNTESYTQWKYYSGIEGKSRHVRYWQTNKICHQQASPKIMAKGSSGRERKL